MPARLPGIAGMKWISVFPDRPLTALVVLSDVETGAPVAILDGAHLTALRTPAASAIAARRLAAPDVETIAIIGPGAQGRAHLTALRLVLPRLRRCRVWGPSRATRERFAAEMSRGHGLEVEAADSPEERLRSLICHFLGYLLDPARPNWKRRLMAREMANPTTALDELVEKNIRPLRDEFLLPTLRELTGGCFSRRQLSYFGSSVMSQCLYFLQSRPIIERLNPDFKIGKSEIAEIAEHITRFSLAAIAELTRQARRSFRHAGARPGFPRLCLPANRTGCTGEKSPR